MINTMTIMTMMPKKNNDKGWLRNKPSQSYSTTASASTEFKIQKEKGI